MNKIIVISLLVCCLAQPTLRTTEDLSCKVHNPRKIDCGYYGINQKNCEEKGCCWKQDVDPSIPWCFLGQDDRETIRTTGGLSCAVEKVQRLECGYYGINKDECEKNGCCWKVDEDDSLIPWCFQGIEAKSSSSSKTSISITFD